MEYEGVVCGRRVGEEEMEGKVLRWRGRDGGGGGGEENEGLLEMEANQVANNESNPRGGVQAIHSFQS